MSSALQQFRAIRQRMEEEKRDNQPLSLRVVAPVVVAEPIVAEHKETEVVAPVVVAPVAEARGAKVEKPFIRREWINDFQVGEEITVKDYHSGFLPAKVLKINKNTITIEIRRNTSEFSKLHKEVRYERESLKKIGEQ
jgi:hypothetical protein